MKKIILSLVVGLLAGCSSPEVVNRSADSTPTESKVRLFVASNRYLSLEPCGCSFKPLGGLEREANAFKEIGRDGALSVKVTSGTTFLPQAEAYKAKQLGHYKSKAEFLADGLKTLAFDAVAPSLDDTLLGEAALKELEKRAGIPFVGANLFSKSGTALFKPFVIIKKADKSIYITGVSSAIDRGYAATPEFEARPSGAAVKAVLAANPPPPGALLVVLSNLAEDERRKLAEEVPAIHIIAGGSSVSPSDDVEYVSGNTLYVNPNDRGRSLAYFNFALDQHGVTTFYSSALSASYVGAREFWQSQIAQIDSQLKNKTKRKQSLATLQREKKKFEGFLAKTAGVALDYKPGMTRVDGNVILLDTKYDGKNPLTALIEKYKDSIRALALDGE